MTGLYSFVQECDDVQLPLELLGDDGAQGGEVLHSVNWGVIQGDGGGWGWSP